MRIKKLKPKFKNLTRAKARLIAHLIGDGCVYKCRTDYNIKYDNIDLELIDQFLKDLKNTYGLETPITHKPSGKTGKMLPYVRVRSKLAYEDLRRYCNYFSNKWLVPKEILKAKQCIQKEFLKALYDDEGSVIPQGKNAIIRLYSINLNGLTQVQKMVDNFKINSCIKSGYGSKRNVYGLIIKDIIKFNSNIGFYCLRKKQKLKKYVKQG